MKRSLYLNRYQIVSNAAGAPVVLRRHASTLTYKAEDTRSGEEVAVEVMPAFELRPRAREELEREAEGAEKLSHINLPALLQFGVEGDDFVYVWEYVAGTSAESWVTEHGPTPIASALRIALQIVSALAAAAFHSLVHRAINPRNIILVPGQTPQGDWPLVKIINLTGGGSRFAGSSAESEDEEFASKFASPEQLQHGGVDFRSEIYSLGATLWFFLTGAAPIAGEELPRLNGLPKPVMQLLDEMLAEDPNARPLDPVAFQERVRECLAHVERREAIAQSFGVTTPAAVSAATIEPRSPILWRPIAVAAAALMVATLAAALLISTLHPGRWFTRSGEKKPIGVPIGVSSVAPSASTATSVAKNAVPSAPLAPQNPPATIVSTASASAAPKEAAVAAASPNAAGPPMPATNAPPNPNKPPPAAIAQGAPPAPTTSRNTSLGQKGGAPPEVIAPVISREKERAVGPVAVARTGESKREVKEPEAPSEGPPGIANTPPRKTIAREAAVDRIPEESENNAQSAEMATDESGAEEPRRAEPVDAPEARRAVPVERAGKANRRPRRIDGMEVRPAEPVREENVPGLPPRSRRARFLGFDADGQMIFELPSSEEGFAEPRR